MPSLLAPATPVVGEGADLLYQLQSRESGSCTSPRQPSRVDPIGRGSDEPP